MKTVMFLHLKQRAFLFPQMATCPRLWIVRKTSEHAPFHKRQRVFFKGVAVDPGKP